MFLYDTAHPHCSSPIAANNRPSTPALILADLREQPTRLIGIPLSLAIIDPYEVPDDELCCAILFKNPVMYCSYTI
jgi:hypothetical protein